MSNSNNQINIPQAREAMDRFKMQAAQEVDVNLTNGCIVHLTFQEAVSVGGQMVKKRWRKPGSEDNRRGFRGILINPMPFFSRDDQTYYV